MLTQTLWADLDRVFFKHLDSLKRQNCPAWAAIGMSKLALQTARLMSQVWVKYAKEVCDVFQQQLEERVRIDVKAMETRDLQKCHLDFPSMVCNCHQLIKHHHRLL